MGAIAKRPQHARSGCSCRNPWALHRLSGPGQAEAQLGSVNCEPPSRVLLRDSLLMSDSDADNASTDVAGVVQHQRVCCTGLSGCEDVCTGLAGASTDMGCMVGPVRFFVLDEADEMLNI
eukprot:1916709-Rhodomonas_salina.1